ncbi:hypothetical protein [Streptomyces albidochromogenes]|nr:hypothetical protein [Streptomyces albidochromogenes]
MAALLVGNWVWPALLRPLAEPSRQYVLTPVTTRPAIRAWPPKFPR